MGPYKSKTHNGCTLFLTIVDDFTRTTWTHLLKCKNDVVSVITSFLEMVETQFNTKVLCVRSDNALELCEGDMKLLLLNKGIIHQTSCSRTPQTNRVVKRKNLLETARALDFQS